MKLVAGLGNPGTTYRGTRHNVGFEVLETVHARHAAHQAWSLAGEALECRWRRPTGDVLLVQPLTFMNGSGTAIGERARFYKIDVADILIVCDDVNLPLGRLRARAGGSEGGHNGLRSVAEHLGTSAYARLRVGVGRGDARRDLANHVLARFEAEERPASEDAIARAADAVDVWCDRGLEPMMNRFNRVEDRPA